MLRLLSSLRDLYAHKKLQYFLRVFVCVALLGYIFIQYDAPTILTRLKGVKVHFLLLAFLMNYLAIGISSLKWERILKSNGNNTPFLELWGYYLEGQFFNLFFPGFIAGDVSRMVRTSKKQVLETGAVLPVVLERLSGLLVFCLYIGLVGFFGVYSALDPLWRKLIVVITLFTVVFLVSLLNLNLARYIVRLLPGRLKSYGDLILNQLTKSVDYLRLHPRLLRQLTLLSFFFVLLTGPVAFAATRSVDLHIPFSLLVFYAPLIALLSSLPLSIAGIGVRENLAVLFYGALGYQAEEIIAYGLAQSAVVFFVNLSGGLILLHRISTSTLQSKRSSDTL